MNDTVLTSSFLRYVDEFEKDALKSIMNKDSGPVDEEVYDNVIAVLSRCQSARLPTRENIHQLVCSVAMSELVCKPTHALQAIHKGLVAAHPEIWRCISIKDIDHLYSDLIPTPRRVWQLISPVTDILSRQEEKVLDFLCCFILSLDSRMLGLFLRFVSGSSYAGPKIKVDFNSQEPGFKRSPQATTGSSHLHLSTTYATLKEFLNVLSHSDQWYMDMQ